jgi:hypothetical protein
LGTSALVQQHDFFELHPDILGQFDAVVGNPPFIRFHRFVGRARSRALAAARAAGIRLTALSSAWAPFLAHATQFVKPGGRLAMVAPAELLHAAYALPVLGHICRAFGRTVIITFERRLFPDLSQDTVLVLCDGRGKAFRELRLLNLADVPQLETLTQVDPGFEAGRPLPVEPLVSGRQRAILYLLPDATRELYVHLQEHAGVSRLGDWSTATIGYVTGNNGFFHLSSRDAERLGIPPRYLRRAVRRADDLEGLCYTDDDWLAASARGAACNVLALPADSAVLPRAVRSYVKDGEAQRVHLAYKCAARRPWYSVPGLEPPDAFLSYMVHVDLAFSVNHAQAVAPNSLLVVRRRPATPAAENIAVAMTTHLAALSAEVQGHSLGGGLLKLEPGEAARLALPTPSRVPGSLFSELDALLRAGRRDEAHRVADAAMLRNTLGLSARDCTRLSDGARMLRQRRLYR